MVMFDRDMVMMGEMVGWDLLEDYRLIVRDRLAYSMPCRSTNDIYICSTIIDDPPLSAGLGMTRRQFWFTCTVNLEMPGYCTSWTTSQCS